jgi:hypothetical protein
MTREELEKRILGYFGLTEAVRSDGSFEALRDELTGALAATFGQTAGEIRILWTFPDRIIAYQWQENAPSRVWEITWQRDEAGAIAFGTPIEVKQVISFEPMAESAKPAAGRKFTETIDGAISLGEAQEGNGGRRIKAVGITADVVNANGRRYPRRVLAAAVAKLNSHLSESNGQGRYIATGEAEHPSDKGTRPSVTETIVRWDAASLDSTGKVLLEGAIIPTAKGKDITAILEAGIMVGVSMRGFGSFVAVNESGETVNEVTELTIRGFDLVAQPSDPNGAITEADQAEAEQAAIKPKERKIMELEELIKLIKGNPAMLAGIMESLNLADAKALTEALAKAEAAGSELAERKNADAVSAAIAEGTKDLPYGEKMNALFVEAVKAAKPATVEAVKALIEAKRKEYDGMKAAGALVDMGKVEVKGPVFESVTGQPEFTKAAFDLNESLIAAQEGTRHNLTAPVTPGEFFAKKILAEFDRRNRQHLINESRSLQEAELTSDLNLPYSIARAIIEQAYPELIAASVYDFGVAANSPERIYYESYTGEAGSYATVTNEDVTSDTDAWVSLANKRVRPGTVVVKDTTLVTTYAEGTDYVIDYGDGKLWTINGGGISDATGIKVTYTYDVFRKGEGAAIQRAKNALTYTQLDMAADRLATQISTEAIVFSRSQMGYDAVTRTLGNLSRLVRRKIDKDILWKGLSASLIQANNSGGTWTAASDDVALFAKYIGVAKAKVANRFYMPTAIVMSVTNADRLSNWADGFKREGFPNAVLDAAGYAGAIKGLPIFASPEFPDKYAQVIHRELVAHRVFSPMVFKGPFPSYDSNGLLIGEDQFYCEEFNGSIVPVKEKTAHVIIA